MVQSLEHLQKTKKNIKDLIFEISFEKEKNITSCLDLNNYQDAVIIIYMCILEADNFKANIFRPSDLDLYITVWRIMFL